MTAATRPGGRVVVVGGGGAGGTLARTLQRGAWPGTVTVLSAELHAPYDRTMLSKAALVGTVDEPRPLLADDPAPDACPVDVVLDAAVVAVDVTARRATTTQGREVDWDHLVLAPGARPRLPDLPGLDLPGVHTLRERAAWEPLRDLVRSGGHMVVIGGGLIGLEVAAAATEHGTRVTVVEVADRLMGRLLPPDLASAIADAHAARGVDLLLGAMPTRIKASSGSSRLAVHLADGTTLPTDGVLVSVGSAPRLDLAVAMGLEVDDGIVVDEYLRTSVDGIHAIGDVVRIRRGDSLAPRTEAWTPAASMGQHVARGLLQDPSPWREVPWMWSDQYDLQVQAVGDAVAGLDTVARGDLDDDAGQVVFGLREGRVHGAVGVGRGRMLGRTVRGAQALVAAGIPVRTADLADPDVDLRALARATG